MRRPRFRLRTLMVAVAIVGLACGGEALRRRRVYFLGRADYHASRERVYLEELDFFTRMADGLSRKAALLQRWREGATANREQAVIASRSSKYHEMMRLKYERAARYPWLPVPPDPPEPK